MPPPMAQHRFKIVTGICIRMPQRCEMRKFYRGSVFREAQRDRVTASVDRQGLPNTAANPSKAPIKKNIIFVKNFLLF